MNYCGVLNIDKPMGLTSRDVVDRVVRLVRPAKVGHAGTLDPLATGVLVVCVGHATRLISLVQAGRKRYRGRFQLGQHSNTDDNTGQVTLGGDCSRVSVVDLVSLLPEFIGRIPQVPPQFSAIHVNGQRAYDLARRGEIADLTARPVDIFSIRITDFQLPEFELEIECGSGTYVRSIGRDLGLRLGCGAIMTELRRLSVGAFDVVEAISPDVLNPNTLDHFLQPALKVVSHWQQRQLADDELVAIRRGQSIAPVKVGVPSVTGLYHATSSIPPSIINQFPVLPFQETNIALIDSENQLVGLAEFDGTTGRLQPRIVFPAEAR